MVFLTYAQTVLNKFLSLLGLRTKRPPSDSSNTDASEKNILLNVLETTPNSTKSEKSSETWTGQQSIHYLADTRPKVYGSCLAHGPKHW